MTRKMPHLGFSTKDRRFGLSVPPSILKNVLDQCVAAKENETGGILVGVYNPEHACALVSQATGIPEDSQVGRTWFHRGIRGLKSYLKNLWGTTREFYLGEWHFHPFAAPSPSNTDRAELARIALSKSSRCPEPVMLIIGGDPKGKWTARAFVYPRGQELELLQDMDLDSSRIADEHKPDR